MQIPWSHLLEILKLRQVMPCIICVTNFFQIKGILLPTNFSRLHKSLHFFRTNDLPQWLSELKEKSIPESCCTDYILWQCYIDRLVENEMSLVRRTGRVPSKS